MVFGSEQRREKREKRRERKKREKRNKGLNQWREKFWGGIKYIFCF